MMTLLPVAAAALAGAGTAEALVGWSLTASFVRRRPIQPHLRPPVTVLKPLHGDEPLLDEALATLCTQRYPDLQVVFGVQQAADTAVAVVRRLQARFPRLDMTLVVEPTLHGPNRKVGNLINMMAAARHDILVIADADIHVRPDYLDRLVAALQQPGVGLVTTLYAGLPLASPPGRMVMPSTLGAMQITYGFLPGALLARALGRQDCLGATMCLRRADLQRIGGFQAIVGHLADDNVLGRLIQALGLKVALAQSVPLTTVPETRFGELFRHELRWARTIRALEPLGFAASVLQYPLAWSLLAVLLSDAAWWPWGLFLLAWALRALAARGIDRALSLSWQAAQSSPERAATGARNASAVAFRCPVWLLPLRDVLSVTVMLASYGGRRVVWRGHGMHADTPPKMPQPVRLRSLEGINAR